MSTMDSLLGLSLDEVAKKLNEGEGRMPAVNTNNSRVQSNKEKQHASQVPVDTERIMDMTLDSYAAILRHRTFSGPNDKTNVLANKQTKTVFKTSLKDQTLEQHFQNYKRAGLAGIRKRTYTFGTHKMPQNSFPKQQFQQRFPRNTLSFQKQPDARHLLVQQRKVFVPQTRQSNMVFKTFDKQRFNSQQVAPVRKQFVPQQEVINLSSSDQWVPMQRQQQPQRQTFQSQPQPQPRMQQQDAPQPTVRFATRAQQQQQHQQPQPSYHFEQQQPTVQRHYQHPEPTVRYVQQPEPAVRYVQQPLQQLQQQQPAARQVQQPTARQVQQRFITQHDAQRWDGDNEPSRTSNSSRIVHFRRDLDARQLDTRQSGFMQEPQRAITKKPTAAYPTVKVSNIPLEYTRLDILGAFKDHFDVHDVIMKNRGTAFVLFRNMADARQAKQKFDGGEMNDHKIKVSWTDNIVV
eukprot:GEMP01000720.1.p1 GENE.GEMP01000720.1~~GEMP01000720.1.p1  ORF type:complete len:461 (+),score=124.89 GEMP01000720.1:52-1434(+)